MKYTYSLCSLLVGLLLPATASALSLQAADTVAGLGTDIDITQAAPNETYTVVVTPPLGNAVVADVTANNDGTASLHISGRETEVAGQYNVHLEQAEQMVSATGTFEVLADTTHSTSSTLTSDVQSIAADGQDSARVTVILRDRYGNPLQGRPVKLISSRSQDVVEPLSNETNDRGEQRFRVRTQSSGTAVLRAIDFISGEILGSELTITAGSATTAMGGTFNTTTNNNAGRRFYGSADAGNTSYGTNGYTANLQAQVNYGPVAGFVIAAPRNLKVNEDATIRITAVDANGNRVEDYVGTVLLSSTDPNAFLPISGRIPFRAQDLGEKQLTLGLRFRTAGEHILHAEDSQNPSVAGETVINVSGGGTGQTGSKFIAIDQPEDGAVINTPTVTITGTTEPFVNLVATGGEQDVTGETDINGEFAIDVELNPDQTEHTLRVQDETGLLDSGDIAVTLDQTPPAIESVSFSPENPVEGTDVLVVAKVDDSVSAFSAKLDGEPLDMETAPGKPNTYQALITAPDAGAHELQVTVADDAQNEAVKTNVLRTELKGLPRVTGVEANTEGEIITLQWNPVTKEEVDAYRIYVGETPTEFAFSLETKQATPSAQVTGLQPGTDYYFAVTALQGERESDKKSEVATASAFGMRLETSGRPNAIQLDWSNMQTTIPLSSFILEYGVEPGKYTEKRILNGDLRNYTIRDLINEVTYYIKLTPVSLTGEKVEEMVAEVEEKPVQTAAGFQPTTADPVPDNVVGGVQADVRTPPPNVHQAAPSTSSTGLPSYAWWLSGALAVVLLRMQWKRRQKMQKTIAFMQAMDARYRHS